MCLKKQQFIRSSIILLIFTFLGCSPEDGMNGMNGTNGLNSLVRTIIELPGTNCANGGFNIQTGLDINSNGVLEESEIDNIEFICNGEVNSTAFKTYVALLSQDGLNNPSSNVLENTLDLNIDWIRESPGKYLGTLNKPIIINKTVIFFTTPVSHTIVRGEIIGVNQVRMELQNGINAFQDNFTNLSFELRQYD
jgi:hypothetical protein